MHEHIPALGDLEHARGRRSVAGEDDLAAGARRAEDLLGADRSSVGELDCLARLEAAEERPFRDAELPRGLDVEAAGPRQLDEGVAVRRDAVGDLDREDPVVAAVERVAVAELDQLDGVGQLPEDAAKPPEEVLSPGGPYTVSGSCRPRRANVFSIPGRPR